MSVLAAAFAPGSIELGVSASDWREAIQAACKLLVASGRATDKYSDACIAVTEQLGPYIVIAPGIALAHAKPTPETVLQTGLALAVLAEPVAFGNAANDPVRLVFALAATDHDGHLDLMSELAERLSDQSFVNFLLNSGSTEEIRSSLSR